MVIRRAARPRMARLRAKRGPGEQDRGQKSAGHHRRDRNRFHETHEPSQRLGGCNAGESRLGDHLARYESRTSDQRCQERHEELVGPRVDELRGAIQRAGDDDDSRDSRACRKARVHQGAHQSADSDGGEQIAIPRCAEVEPLGGIEDELHGLSAVGQLDHADHEQQRDDVRRRPSGPQAFAELVAGALSLARARRNDTTAKHRDESRRDGERESVDQEGNRVRRQRQDDRPDCRTDHDADVLHRVQKGIGGADPCLTDHPRQHCHRGRPLGGPRA